MWLINTETGDLENVPVPIRGSYAILSHTWEDEEISFQLYRNSRSLAMDSKGYAKVAKTLELARSWDLMYAWVDTCCIDKSSSAELSEAINSMYSWYSNAAVCFAFLSDFDPYGQDAFREEQVGICRLEEWQDLMEGWKQRCAETLSSCRWFRRGWTFQELIAPAEVEFYDAEWNYIGNKTDTMISRAINQVTRIPIALLNQTNSVRSFSIAQRMSWVADRETTRIEDVAYSLLGLFHVNMPLLYGEGRKAFVRLQEEICKQSNDLSIFAWKARCDDEFADSPRYRDIFAHSPSEYHDCHNLILSRKKFFEGEIRITSRGVCLDPGQLYRLDGRNRRVLVLDCVDSSSEQLVAIALTKGRNGYVRSSPNEHFYLDRHFPLTMGHNWDREARLYIAKSLDCDDISMMSKRFAKFDFGLSTPRNVFVSPQSGYDPVENIVFPDGEEYIWAMFVDAPRQNAEVDRFLIIGISRYYDHFGSFFCHVQSFDSNSWDNTIGLEIDNLEDAIISDRIGSFDPGELFSWIKFPDHQKFGFYEADAESITMRAAGIKYACYVRMTLIPGSFGMAGEFHISLIDLDSLVGMSLYDGLDEATPKRPESEPILGQPRLGRPLIDLRKNRKSMPHGSKLARNQRIQLARSEVVGHDYLFPAVDKFKDPRTSRVTAARYLTSQKLEGESVTPSC